MGSGSGNGPAQPKGVWGGAAAEAEGVQGRAHAQFSEGTLPGCAAIERQQYHTMMTELGPPEKSLL